MAIYLSDIKIDLTVKRYGEKIATGERVSLERTGNPDLELKEQHEHKNMTLREALQKLVELVF